MYTKEQAILSDFDLARIFWYFEDLQPALFDLVRAFSLQPLANNSHSRPFLAYQLRARSLHPPKTNLCLCELLTFGNDPVCTADRR